MIVFLASLPVSVFNENQKEIGDVTTIVQNDRKFAPLQLAILYRKSGT
jgi:hypothetical protein